MLSYLTGTGFCVVAVVDDACIVVRTVVVITILQYILFQHNYNIGVFFITIYILLLLLLLYYRGFAAKLS